MSAAPKFDGRYYDGVTARAHAVAVEIAGDGLSITGATVNVFWPAKRLRLISRDDREIRLANRKDENARLALDAAAAPVLVRFWPDILSGQKEKRRMAILIAALFFGTAAIAAVIFLGVPAASAPLARATPKDLEIRIGENLAAQITIVMRSCAGSEKAIAELSPILDRFAADNDVGFPIRFQFVQSSAPNAFALPGGQVMATSGLLTALKDDQEAFIAVMAHELGHVRARDGLQAVYRNAGVGVALDIITGGSGAAQQAVIVAGQLNQMRHSRQQESAADDAAAEMLLAAALDPAALARALEAISAASPGDGSEIGIQNQKRDQPEIPTWLSSHPDTDLRIAAARKRAAKGGPLPIDGAAWARVATACDGSAADD